MLQASGEIRFKLRIEGSNNSIEKEKMVEINMHDGSGKREVTMRKSSLRESRNYDVNSHATPVNTNG